MPQFAKRTLRSFARKLGLLVADVSRIGIELENDVSRLKNPSEFKIILDVGGNHGQSAIRFSYFFLELKYLVLSLSRAIFICLTEIRELILE